MKHTEAEQREYAELRADEMRRTPTKQEFDLWMALDGPASSGWYLQQPVEFVSKNGGRYHYIIDIFHRAAKLAIELDGGHHWKQKGRDRRRDTRLAQLGIETIRIPNKLLSDRKKKAATLARVRTALQKRLEGANPCH